MIVSMGTPQFILNLRKKIGHDELWLPGVTGVILRSGDGGGGEGTAQEVLLVQRSDNHHWTPVTGICEPSEQPDTAIMREALEETGLQIQVDRLLWVQAIDALTYINGDIASYMDTAFACSVVPGTSSIPHVADEESVAVGWFHVDELPAMKPRFEHLITIASTGTSRSPAGWGPAST